jgi:tetratricopeptide (TPR) repeat protein
MKTSVKIALSAVIAFLCVVSLCATAVIYFAVSFYQGQRLFDEAVLAMSHRDYETAMSTFRAALGKHLRKTYRAYALGDLAFCESADSRCDDAIRHYTEALRLDPTLAWVYESRGWLYDESAESDRALQDFSDAIRLDPNLYHAHFNRGLIELDRKDLDGALDDFAEAARIDPSSAPAYYDRGIVYSLKREYDRALANFDAAIQMNPKYAAALVERAYVYAARRELDKAITDLNKAIRVSPGRGAAYRARGFMFTNQKRWNEAIADFNKALELNPRDTSALDGRAKTYSLLGDQEHAIADFTAVLEHWNLPYIYSSRGYAYSNKGDYDRALADFREGVKLMPEDDSALNSLAWFLSTCPDAKFRNGNEAVTVAMKACVISRWRDAYQVDTLAAAYAETGQFNEAVAYQIKAISYDRLDQTKLNEMQKRRALYEQRKPYRQINAR